MDDYIASIYASDRIIPPVEKIADDLEEEVLKHFNSWEWFALLVNHREIREDYLKNYFKEDFKSEYEEILSKFPDLYQDDNTFPEVKALYKEWYKTDVYKS